MSVDTLASAIRGILRSSQTPGKAFGVHFIPDLDNLANAKLNRNFGVRYLSSALSNASQPAEQQPKRRRKLFEASARHLLLRLRLAAVSLQRKRFNATPCGHARTTRSTTTA